MIKNEKVMRLELRKITGFEKVKAMNFVWKVFLEFEAPLFTDEGIESFRKFITNKDIIKILEVYGAYENEKIIGAIATRKRGNHIALFFVDGKHHRQGIGRKLFEVVLKNSTSDIITVNSSPFATGFYHKLGFVDIDKEQTENGMRFTPMKYHK